MAERWIQIEDFEGYEVSDYGRVRSWWGYTCGPRTRLLEPKLMSGCGRGDKSPYLRVTITSAGRKYTRSIHLCVLTSFVGPRPQGKWGLHGDGHFENNRLDNLRWGTPKENAEDRTIHGRTMFGARNHKSKLTAGKAAAIRLAYETGAADQVRLAATYGVSQASISAVIRRKVWRAAA